MADIQKSGTNQAELMAVGQLAKRLRVSVRHVYRMNKNGLIPRPLKIGACNRWREDEISEWMKAAAPVRAEWEKQGATQTVCAEGQPRNL